MRKLLLVVALIVTAAREGLCANFVTSIAQTGTQDWTLPIWNPGPKSPTAGNTYEVLNGGLVRNPVATSSSTFPGDALILDVGSTLRVKPPSPGTTTIINFPGATNTAGLVLNGGAVNPGTADTSFIFTGTIFVAADSTLLGPSTNGSGRNFQIESAISGTNSITIQDFLDNTGVTLLNVSNAFSGNWLVPSGRLTASAAGSLGPGNISIGSGSTFEVDYDIATPGALLLEGKAVMTLRQSCQFSGVAIEGINLKRGTYAYSQLKAQFPANFAIGGTGSITVAPFQPTLTLTVNNTNALASFQTLLAHNYVLQATTALGPDANWTAVGNPVAGDAAIHMISIPATTNQMFYRLLVE